MCDDCWITALKICDLNYIVLVIIIKIKSAGYTLFYQEVWQDYNQVIKNRELNGCAMGIAIQATSMELLL